MSRRPSRNGKHAPREKRGEPGRRPPHPAPPSARARTARPAPEGELIYGQRAGLAVLETRPGDVRRVGYDAALQRELRDVLRACAARQLPCTALSEGELSRLAHSDQHEGLLLETAPRKFAPPVALAELLVKKRGLAIAFDRVRNPYNIGAVLRTAAFFGVDAALLGTPAPHPALPAQAVRVAEGGAEHLMLCRTTDLADTLGRLRKAGVLVAGAEDYGTSTVASVVQKRPLVLVLGHEREGLSDRVRAQCDAMVAIKGSGHVRSLNVSIAASILIAQLSG
jgi:RNA methyltransferase, TrmH family